LPDPAASRYGTRVRSRLSRPEHPGIPRCPSQQGEPASSRPSSPTMLPRACLKCMALYVGAD